MVSFGISPMARGVERCRNTAQDNQPAPTSPRQSRLERLTPYSNRQPRPMDHFYQDTVQANRPNSLPDARKSPVSVRERIADGVPESGSSWRQWAGANSSHVRSSPGRSPEEIQRRRRLLDEGGFTASGYRQQQLPETRTEAGKEFLRRDPLNSLEKRSTLKIFAENSARGANLRKVTFKLGHEETSMATAGAVVNDEQPPAATPESAKHRKRGSSAVPGFTTGSASTDAAKAKRPISSKTREMQTHDPSCRVRTTQNDIVVRKDQAEGDQPKRKDTNIERTVALQNHPTATTYLTLAKVSAQKYHRNIVTGPSTSPALRHQQTKDDQSSVAGLKAVALREKLAFSLKDEDNQKPIYSRSSLIHNVSLTTKLAGQKNCLVELTMADKLRNMEYQCISCHDWSCNCSRPECVTRYDFKDGQKHFDSVAQVTTRKDYILPQGCRLASGHASSRVPVRWQSRHSVNKIEVHNDDKTATVDDDLNFQKRMELAFSRKPVSVHGAFRVSGPHWASRSHTQRWPWRGTTWVSVCGDDVTSSRNCCAVK